MDNSNLAFVAHLSPGGLKTILVIRIKTSFLTEKRHYQEDRNDEAKETNSAAEDFNNEYLDEKCWIGSIRKSSSRSNLRKD